jgi:xanthine phosphoribosyltransferase
MERLVKKIKEEAYVIDNRIVKVDHFINHMLDTELVFEIGKEFSEKFPNATKILTIETSGIAFAVGTAFHLNNIPIVFAKKTPSLITDSNVYSSKIYSFTKQVDSNVTVSKNFLTSKDKVLIIDDFLAMGSALSGLISIAEQAGAEIIGAGIVIEKGFQEGRKNIKNKGIQIHSLANIVDIKNNIPIFR